MSLLPSLRIEFNKALNNEQRAEIVQKVRAIKGVISVGYREGGDIASVTFSGGQSVRTQIGSISGIKVDARHRF